MKTKLLMVLIVVLAILAYGFTNTQTGQMINSKKIVKIGVLEPLTGVRAEAGKYVSNGLEIALKEINEDVKRKYKLELIYQDTKYDPKEAVSGFQKLTSVDGVKFIIGAHGSSETLALAPLAEQTKTILVTASSQASGISDAGDYIFRTQINVKQEAPFFARYLSPIIGKEPIHIIGINTDYLPSYLDAFKPELEKLGGSVGLVEKFEVKETDFRSALTKISATNPKHILIIATPKQSATILKQATEFNLNVTWFGPSPIEGQELFSFGQQIAEGLVYVYPYDDTNTDTVMKSFTEKYFTAHKQKNEMLSANGYDTLYLLSNCFEKVETNVDDVKDCLYSIKDYRGASGTLTFDSKGDISKPFIIKTVRDGKFVKLESV